MAARSKGKSIFIKANKFCTMSIFSKLNIKMQKERAPLANALRNSLFSFYKSLKHVEALLAVASGAGRIVLEKRSVRFCPRILTFTGSSLIEIWGRWRSEEQSARAAPTNRQP
ncbi:hypothetical protein ABEW32_08200 [Paenibacillus jamilae]|uniref:hypothetical protein n=1 Tax=Paenibacillus jamilae TaxID=114136 RepID=UPI003D2C18A0